MTVDEAAGAEAATGHGWPVWWSRVAGHGLADPVVVELPKYEARGLAHVSGGRWLHAALVRGWSPVWGLTWHHPLCSWSRWRPVNLVPMSGAEPLGRLGLCDCLDEVAVVVDGGVDAEALALCRDRSLVTSVDFAVVFRDAATRHRRGGVSQWSAVRSAARALDQARWAVSAGQSASGSLSAGGERLGELVERWARDVGRDLDATGRGLEDRALLADVLVCDAAPPWRPASVPEVAYEAWRKCRLDGLGVLSTRSTVADALAGRRPAARLWNSPEQTVRPRWRGAVAARMRAAVHIRWLERVLDAALDVTEGGPRVLVVDPAASWTGRPDGAWHRRDILEAARELRQGADWTGRPDGEWLRRDILEAVRELWQGADGVLVVPEVAAGVVAELVGGEVLGPGDEVQAELVSRLLACGVAPGEAYRCAAAAVS